MNKIYYLLIVFIAISCNDIETKGNDNDYFYGFVNNRNNNILLTIKTRFDECGEWGGHFEKITVFNKNDKKIYAKFELSDFDCSNGNQNPKIIKIEETEINENEKSAIKDYLKELVEFKSKSYEIGHAGMSYSAISQDSTFIINTYNNDDNCKNAFKNLKSKLKF